MEDIELTVDSFYFKMKEDGSYYRIIHNNQCSFDFTQATKVLY